LFVSGSALFALAGWIRFACTGQLTVDNNYCSAPVSYIICALVAASVTLLSFASLRLLRHDAPVVSPMVRAISIVLLIACPPLLSNDVFSYLYYGEFAFADPYSSSIIAFADENTFYSYISPVYKDTLCVYGPLSLLACMLPAIAGNVWISLLLYKLVNVCFYLLLLRRAKPYPRLLPVIFSSVLLLEIVAQGHNDIIAIYFIFAAIDAALHRKSVTSAMFGLFMLLSKILYFPFLFICGILLFRHSIRKGLLWLGLTISGIAAWYFVHPASLTGPLATGHSLRTSGSWADLMFEFIKVLQPGWENAPLLTRLFQAVALLSCLVIFLLFLRKRKLPADELPVLVSLFIIPYFVFFIHRLFPWYMVFTIPLFLMNRHLDVKWLIAGMAVFVLQGLVHQFPSGTAPATVIIVATTMATLVLLTIWAFLSVKNTLNYRGKLIPGG